MRAFARDLGMDPGQLSNVIQGKKHISLLNAAKVVRNLTDHPIEAQLFYHAVEYSQATAEEQRTELKEKILRLSTRQVSRESNISDEEFSSIAEWYHVALMQLALKAPIDSKQAAEYFGIAIDQAKLALNRLVRLGFMQKQGEWYRRLKQLVTTTDIPSLAIRQFHLQMLEKAKIAIFNQPVKKRYLSSVTLRISRAQLDEYKKIIDETEDRLMELSKKFEDEPDNEVYHFSSQLFSLKKENE